MSQIYKSSGGSSAADVETLTGNTGGAVGPDAAFNINILGDDSTSNNINGLTVVGNAATNTLTVTLTNRIQGSVTTNDATPTTLITFVLPSTGTYAFDINVSAYNTTDVLGAAYSVFVGVRSSAGVAAKLNLEDKIVNEEAGMAACDASISISGNSLLLQVTGIAAKTINWNAVGTYVFVGT
jgi:hypothetical protein